MSKHTPGPWYVGAQNDMLYILDRKPAASNDYPNHERKGLTCIARVYDPTLDASEANARLMAAAPEMFEALLCADCALAGSVPLQTAKTVIANAIAKAEGRA
jgi:hypothetical protein